jgi:hypothetical protein
MPSGSECLVAQAARGGECDDKVWVPWLANEAVLLWRAFEPAYECGPDAQTHNELSPQHHREHA